MDFSFSDIVGRTFPRRFHVLCPPAIVVVDPLLEACGNVAAALLGRLARVLHGTNTTHIGIGSCLDGVLSQGKRTQCNAQ